jgi:thiamine pyrophosphate-dependent acetolactate synthase large subunit-like protein
MAGDGEHELISGGHLVAKALTAESSGVVDVRHKQVAANATDGYARITGKPGCGTPCSSFLEIPRDVSASATVVQVNLDYRTVGKKRDIYLGIEGGLVLSTQATSGRVKGAVARKAWLEGLINVWVDPDVHEPGTMNQPMYK